MDCSTAQTLMLELVEDVLPPRIAESLRDHVRNCPACTAELEKQSSRTRALQSLGRVSAPDQWDEISRSVRRVTWRNSLRRYGLAALLAVAAAGLVAFAAFVVVPALRGSNPAAPASAPAPAAQPAGR